MAAASCAGHCGLVSGGRVGAGTGCGSWPPLSVPDLILTPKPLLLLHPTEQLGS